MRLYSRILQYIESDYHLKNKDSLNTQLLKEKTGVLFKSLGKPVYSHRRSLKGCLSIVIQSSEHCWLTEWLVSIMSQHPKYGDWLSTQDVPVPQRLWSGSPVFIFQRCILGRLGRDVSWHVELAGVWKIYISKSQGEQWWIF